jgi:hypothetical protein
MIKGSDQERLSFGVIETADGELSYRNAVENISHGDL